MLFNASDVFAATKATLATYDFPHDVSVAQKDDLVVVSGGDLMGYPFPPSYARYRRGAWHLFGACGCKILAGPVTAADVAKAVLDA